MTIHVGATLTPGFREFLPGWVARQPWYRGTSVPALSPVGFFRFEDPAGQVGVETHLVADGSDLYQVPLTYRGAPVEGPALLTTAEHSVLGTRWIYDGREDPVWRDGVLDLVRTGGVSEPSGRQRVGPAGAQGEQLVPGPLTTDAVRVELRRVLTAGTPELAPDTVGLLTGTWHPDGPGTTSVSGCLAVVVPAR